MHSPIAHTSTILVLFLFLDYVYIIRVEFENRLTIFAFWNKIFAEYIRQNKFRSGVKTNHDHNYQQFQLSSTRAYIVNVVARLCALLHAIDWTSRRINVIISIPRYVCRFRICLLQLQPSTHIKREMHSNRADDALRWQILLGAALASLTFSELAMEKQPTNHDIPFIFPAMPFQCNFNIRRKHTMDISNSPGSKHDNASRWGECSNISAIYGCMMRCTIKCTRRRYVYLKYLRFVIVYHDAWSQHSTSSSQCKPFGVRSCGGRFIRDKYIYNIK